MLKLMIWLILLHVDSINLFYGYLSENSLKKQWIVERCWMHKWDKTKTIKIHHQYHKPQKNKEKETVIFQ